MKQIIVIFDIDGVLTDGNYYIGQNDSKRVNFKDLDAVNELKRLGCAIIAVTAENDKFSHWFKNKLPWDAYYDGCDDKAIILKKIRKESKEAFLVYVGDGRKDLDAMRVVDYSFCPADAIDDVKMEADIVLKEQAGSGGIWEVLNHIKRLQNASLQNASCLWDEVIDEHVKLINKLKDDKSYTNNLLNLSSMIYQAIMHNRSIYVMGNGGSAADALHIAAEFLGRFKFERRPINVEAITGNTALITAVGNDYGFEHIFSRQLEAKVKLGDIVIGLSTSGTSKNILKALNTAKDKGAHTVLMTGDNAYTYEYDIVLRIPHTEVARIQEGHYVTGHYLAYLIDLAMQRGDII